MFCGDETAALVGDLGSRSFKFGFAGEDSPKGWIPSCVGEDGSMKIMEDKNPSNSSENGLRIGDVSLLGKSENVEIKWARKDGKIDDWDAYEALWAYGLKEVLKSDPKQHPLLITSPTYESDQDRTKSAEIIFEKIQPPALFLARNAMLSAFSIGRKTACVVDIGASKTCVSCVQDGYTLKSTTLVTDAAGDMIDRDLINMLENSVIPKNEKPIEKSIDVPEQPNDTATQENRLHFRVPCMISPTDRSKTKKAEQLGLLNDSYVTWQKLNVVTDMKSSICRVWSELNYDEKVAGMYAKENYELPDGTVVSMGSNRFKSGELLMHPTKSMGVPQVIKNSLHNAHVDLRKELVQQLILVGGGSLLPGTYERLTKELVQILPSAIKPKFLVLNREEKLFSSFIGGSILATLGSFQQLWISKAEYEEYGSNIINQRCVQ